jgi:hypothetical protein
MRGAKLTIEIPLEAMTHAAMPANVDVLARSYVGDQCFGLALDPKNRALYLLSLTGYWRLDAGQLIAVFADALREWDRELEIARGVSPAALRELLPAAPLMPTTSAWRRSAPVAAAPAKRQAKRKAG